MSKYDGMGLSQEEIAEMERLDAEEFMAEKRQKAASMRDVKYECSPHIGVVVKAMKSKNGYQLLAVFFGVLGLHDVYAGFYKIALLYLLSTMAALIFYPPLILGIWFVAIIEAIVSVKDSKGNKLE